MKKIKAFIKKYDVLIIRWAILIALIIFWYLFIKGAVDLFHIVLNAI